MSNKERQSRWRDERNSAFSALRGTPDEFVEAVLRANGVKRAKSLAAALTKRLKAISPACKRCKGTGYMPVVLSTACGIPLFGTDKEAATAPCDCAESAEAMQKMPASPPSCSSQPPPQPPPSVKKQK
jgi:hypothetical protein